LLLALKINEIDNKVYINLCRFLWRTQTERPRSRKLHQFSTL
jgi:hypothetical protein